MPPTDALQPRIDRSVKVLRKQLLPLLQEDARGRMELADTFSTPRGGPVSLLDLEDHPDMRAALEELNMIVVRDSAAPWVSNRWIMRVGGVFIITDLPSYSKPDCVYSYPDEANIAIEQCDIEGLDRGSEVLDLCCGAGSIGLALAMVRPDLRICLADYSPRAVEHARLNRSFNGLSTDRVEVLESNLFAGLQGRTFDLIIADPPFRARPASDGAAPDFDAGEAGDRISRRIMEEVERYLKDHGRFQMLAYELGSNVPGGFSFFEDLAAKHLRSCVGRVASVEHPVWRFMHGKVFDNPVLLDHLIIKLADPTSSNNILERSPPEQRDRVRKYIEWIGRLKRRQRPDRENTHLRFSFIDYKKINAPARPSSSATTGDRGRPRKGSS